MHLRRPALAGLALASCLAPWGAEAGIPRQEKAQLRLAADRSAYEAGSAARLAAVVEIEDGWHVNAHRASFDYLIPTELALQLPPGWPEPEITYPEGELKSFAFEDRPLNVYEGRIAIFARLQIPGDAPEGQAPILVRLTYQACDDTRCLAPVTTEERFRIEIGPGGEPINLETFAAAAGGGPPPRLALILLLGLLGGLILNAMPCVLPVLSLKVFGLVQTAGRGRSAVVAGALATAAGILASFLALALAAVAARSAGAAVGWGIQFQQPTFVTFLAVVVVLFSLNLWGLFEIPLPRAFARLAAAGPREGLGGHFAAGLFTTLMATPCSAPFLGTAVSFALGQKAAVVLATFTAIGAGMALPYLALAAAPGAARYLPKPGPWMERLKLLMGFLLAATAVWLLYVLSSQVSPERLAAVELGLLALAFFIWVRHRAVGGLARGGAAAGVAGAIAATLALAVSAPGEAALAGPLGGDGLIEWVRFDRQEAERLAAQGRLVFVDVTADWCFTCKVNEGLVLETRRVAEAFRTFGVVAMKADWTNRSDAIARFMADHGRYGIPFYLLYRPGARPHLFGELISQEEIVRALETARRADPAASPGP